MGVWVLRVNWSQKAFECTSMAQIQKFSGEGPPDPPPPLQESIPARVPFLLNQSSWPLLTELGITHFSDFFARTHSDPWILRSPEWASKYFFVKIFAAGAAFFVKSQHPCELQSNLHDLHINSTPKMHENFTSRVGIEKLSHDVEWAAKIFYRAMSGLRNFFSQISIWTRSPPLP